MHLFTSDSSFATYLIHRLYILLSGKWDPLQLLDDNDLLISSYPLIFATDHVVLPIEAINEIPDYDPDLSLMPLSFDIYLL
ncbi:hypothetical protein LTR09_011425 [Extremus antarcticus]|uniref:Uncharacterized protein n=1 Tax=Extremus antarcticus TaxID=702011 RepID=A0AAJ0DBT8_9PEZI|nr:hypothetical protein LTR09_011425 [Extremus antarcticus]